MQLLEEKLEEINLSKQKIIGVSCQQNYNEKIEFIKKQIEIVKRFETNLEIGREASTWLSKNIAQLAKSAGKRALNRCPENKSTASPDQIDDFYFSIEQFLEQVSHCLSWGRYNILDSPEIPLVFDIHTYEVAFNLIKEMLLLMLKRFGQSFGLSFKSFNPLLNVLPLKGFFPHQRKIH